MNQTSYLVQTGSGLLDRLTNVTLKEGRGFPLPRASTAATAAPETSTEGPGRRADRHQQLSAFSRHPTSCTGDSRHATDNTRVQNAGSGSCRAIGPSRSKGTETMHCPPVGRYWSCATSRANSRRCTPKSS